MGAGLCNGSAPFLLPDSAEPPPPPLAPPAALQPSSPACKGTGSAVGNHWGGARRAGPGQVHTAALCSGVGRLGAARGPDWLPGNLEGPAVGGGGGGGLLSLPALALWVLNQQLRLRFPQGGGRAERGSLAALGPGGAPQRGRGIRGAGGGSGGGVQEQARQAGTSCSRLLPASPLIPEGTRAGGREGDSPACSARFLRSPKLLSSPAGDGMGSAGAEWVGQRPMHACVGGGKMLGPSV